MDNINEKVTRKKWIDEKLKKAGWENIIPYKEGLDTSTLHKTAIEEYPTATGPVDYALFANGKLVGFVEAKKLGTSPQNVLSQAQRYVKGAEQDGKSVPFIYSTNGEVIWFQNLRITPSRSRQVQEFHTPKALIEYLTNPTHENTHWLINNPPSSEKLRYYQKDAITAIEKAIIDSKRSMLVAMATGTGKTFTVASLIYRLLKSKTSKRILFLVDRKALAAQTVMEFAAYEAENGLKFNQIYQVYSQKFKLDDVEGSEKFDFNVIPTGYLTDPDGNQIFVYVSTIQRMQINLYGKQGMFSYDGDYDEDDDADKIDIPINAFDTIIADECHRGYTSQQVSKWRGVLDHFDAVKIGLTATPAAHTTGYFKEIVYRYTYEKAVQDGYLVDYDAVKIASGVRLKGITLQEGEEIENIDPQTGAQQLDLLEDERHFEVTDVERQITAPDSNRKIIEEFAKYAHEQERELGRFPKTLIFADNDLSNISHADQIVDICRDVFGRGDAFVQKITGSKSVDRPLTRIKEFRNRPEPHIVVTVDMLSTGVDIPSIENILFLRPIKSRILFEQMLGRGTRLCKNFPNGLGTPEKTHFTVFDCFDGTLLEAFKNNTGITQITPLTPTRSIEQIINDLNNNIDIEYNTRCLVKRLQRIAKNITSEGREMFAKYISEGDISTFAKNLPDALSKDRIATLKILTDEKFIDLLKHYPRPPKRFIRAIEQEDIVESEYLFRTTDGRELKPEDYIVQFERFVKENPEHIEAIRIVLNKPKGWNTEALKELRTSLSQQPERFTEDNLRRAYKYPLADIISMVKHAAKDEPLLSAKERVDLAMEKVLGEQKITEKQEQWIELIKLHLVENLTIDPQDFDEMPIFTNLGGTFKRVDEDFDGKLLPFIQEINATIPAVYAYAN
jgi:type I restriction enzyme R subunit